jgi:hypothetical protein
LDGIEDPTKLISIQEYLQHGQITNEYLRIIKIRNFKKRVLKISILLYYNGARKKKFTNLQKPKEQRSNQKILRKVKDTDEHKEKK